MILTVNPIKSAWKHRFVVAIAFLALGLFGTVGYLLYYIFFGQLNPQQLDKTINAADEASAAGRLSEAESLYKRLASEAQTAENPSLLADVVMKLGTVYEREQKLPEAEAALRRAAQLYEERVKSTGMTGFSSAARKHMEVLADLCDILRNRHSYDEAAALYKQALVECDQDPDGSDKSRISLGYARLLRATGKASDADRLEAQVEATNNEANAYQTGKTQFQQGSYVKAEAFFRAFLGNSATKHDGDGGAHACVMIAVCQLLQGNLDEAISLCRQAHILAGKSFSSELTTSVESSVDTITAYVSEVRDHHKEAEDTIDQALKLSPQDAGSTLLDICAVAIASKNKANLAAARTLCLRAAPHLEGNLAGQVWQTVANNAQNERDFAAADENYNKALEYFVKVANVNSQSAVFASLGDDCVLQGKFADGEPFYRKCLHCALKVKNDSMSAHAWWHIADCLYHCGKKAEARDAFEHSYALSKTASGPTSIAVGNVLLCLGNLDKEDGKYKEALERYSLAIPIYDSTSDSPKPDHIELLENASACYLLLGMKKEGEELQYRASALR